MLVGEGVLSRVVGVKDSNMDWSLVLPMHHLDADSQVDTVAKCQPIDITVTWHSILLSLAGVSQLSSKQ